MFTIFRDQSAMLPLREIWDEAEEPYRKAILTALENLDSQLQDSPAEQGESRQKGTRILIHDPIAIWFTVDETKQMVHILKAWAYRPR